MDELRVEKLDADEVVMKDVSWETSLVAVLVAARVGVMADTMVAVMEFCKVEMLALLRAENLVSCRLAVL